MSKNPILVFVCGAYGSTSRVWLYTLPGAVTNEAIRKCMDVFKHSSVWGGIDKSDVTDSLQYVNCSIEVPRELAMGIAYSMGRFLNHQRDVEVSICATSPHLVNEARFGGMKVVDSSEALAFINQSSYAHHQEDEKFQASC